MLQPVIAPVVRACSRGEIAERNPARRSWKRLAVDRGREFLPVVLMQVEARAADDRERIKHEREEAERRQLAWEHAKAQARGRYREHHRAEILDAQVKAWQHATAIRAYCDAIEQKYPNEAEASGWVTWARARADALEPLGTAPTTPEQPKDLSPDDLRPFLDGWSPFAPERERGQPRG